MMVFCNLHSDLNRMLGIALFGLGFFLGGAALWAQSDWFEDVAAETGIDFRHQDARFGEKYYIETAASGGGWMDFDQDGDLDLYLVNGAATPGSKLSNTPRNRLYENRQGKFADITEKAGVGDTLFGMGFCVGDVDADGGLDFLVTNYGPDRLYRNLKNGRFEEIGSVAGIDDPRWGASCSFGDVDGDGDLDLYVTHYVDFTFDKNPFCGDRARNLRAYCRPEAFDGVTDSLFINQGIGKDGQVVFRDEATRRGLIEGKNEKGFGVVMSDLDDDGDLDIYVANDGTMNHLYLNDGRGFFADQALISGTGLSSQGVAESGMGVDLADVNADGLLDLLVTNYSMETNTLYRNLGDLLFDDVTSISGLAEISYKYVGWGTRFFDYDNDGDLDLTVANGHAIDNIEIFEAGLSYKQKNQLLENNGKGQFLDVSARAGKVWAVERVSRGLAIGDYNNDGQLDILITNTNDPVDLLRNKVNLQNHWLGIQLMGPPQNPFAIGARARIQLGNKTLTREVLSGGSFMTQSDLRLHFGLGKHKGPIAIEIRWPDGRVQKETTSSFDRYWPITYDPS